MNTNTVHIHLTNMLGATSHTEIQWQPLQELNKLKKNSTHVFKIALDAYPIHLISDQSDVLSTQEYIKAKHFRNQKDEKRYLISRFALRHILSPFISTPPSKIQFLLSDDQKPSVAGIEFNISHSQNYLLIAISPYPIGIDIEYVQKDFDFEILISSCFSLEECTFINSTQNDQRLNFFKLWTRKEALLKASGEGLIDDLTKVNSLESNQYRAGLPFQLSSFLLDEDYIASLAVNKACGDLNHWNYTPYVI